MEISWFSSSALIHNLNSRSTFVLVAGTFLDCFLSRGAQSHNPRIWRGQAHSGSALAAVRILAASTNTRGQRRLTAINDGTVINSKMSLDITYGVTPACFTTVPLHLQAHYGQRKRTYQVDRLLLAPRPAVPDANLRRHRPSTPDDRSTTRCGFFQKTYCR